MSAPLSPSSSARDLGTSQQDSQARTLCVRFNQTGGCFACGTEAGIRVYNCDPFKETIRRNFGISRKSYGSQQRQGKAALCEYGGVGTVEMLFRSNLFAVVGGGEFPSFPVEKVLIWDDHQCKWIGELGFHSKVLGVRLRRDKIVVALKNKIFIYNFEDLKLLQQLESVDNPKGLLALSSNQDRSVLVCPGLQCGQIRIEHLDYRRSNFIKGAHTSALACLGLSLDGSMVASASEKGTLIRVWRTTPKQDGSGNFLEMELRRGSDRAEIYSIAFSPSNSWLAASSSKGTVHIWPLQSNEDPTAYIETSSPSRVIPGFVKKISTNFVPAYFHSKWSLAQYRLGDDTRSQVTFGTKENTLIVITCSGKFHKVQFDIQGGDCKKISFCKFAS
mmetsp:Transcript_12107/g.30728  ORF Transcript_12107/g.30728 Transcript_12107/m.30728 type:complete len:389 (+) Transcript_12107:131-1297(+)